MRGLLKDFLVDCGHEVDTADDGEQGLTRAQTGQYDICICDLHLPKKNGHEIYEELGPQRHNMRFIFTDSLPDGLYEKIRENTGQLCLRKPFDLDQVRRVIEQALTQVKIR
jgi:DNA-binding response OmpR family regulator